MRERWENGREEKRHREGRIVPRPSREGRRDTGGRSLKSEERKIQRCCHWVNLRNTSWCPLCDKTWVDPSHPVLTRSIKEARIIVSCMVEILDAHASEVKEQEVNRHHRVTQGRQELVSKVLLPSRGVMHQCQEAKHGWIGF